MIWDREKKLEEMRGRLDKPEKLLLTFPPGEYEERKREADAIREEIERVSEWLRSGIRPPN